MFKDTVLYEYADRVTRLKGQENLVFQLVLDNRTIKDLIVFLNTEDQMGQDHVDSFGQQLFNRITRRTVYSPNDKKGRGGKPYDLFDTGQYWDSFTATVGQGVIIIKSDPRKGDDNLEEQYGALEGLTDENLQVLIKQAYEFFVEWYRKNLLP